ncbi:hypothetical protein EJB05_36558, partial [Eragrostis curvula]
MSDRVGSRYDKEEIQILLTKNVPLESPQQKNYMWMARWTRASSSAEPQNDSNCNCLEDLTNGTSANDTGVLPSEFMKSTVAEKLMVGVNRRSASVQHSRQFSSNTRGLVHDISKELGPKSNEHGDESFVRCMKKKDVHLHGRAVVSETFSVRKLSGLPLDFQNLGRSDNLSSDWSHFPMFEINPKIDNILNPKRRSSLDPAPHAMALSSQEYMMHSHRISDENMDIHKPPEGIVSHLEGPAGLGSDPSGQKLKGHLSDTMSCSCSKDNNSSDCQIDEQHISHYVANSRHGLPFASSGKKFHFAGNNKDQIAVSAFNYQKSRRSAVYRQQDASGDIFCAPVLGTEYQKEPTDCSYNSKQGGETFQGTFKSHGKAVSSLPCERQHLETQRKESTQKSTGSCKRKGPCLYEMLTTVSQSKSACPKNSVSSGNGFDVCMYGTNIGSRLFGTQNQSSARTETLYSDTLVVSKSSAGIASSLAQKDHVCPNEAKAERLATPPARRDSDSKENESHIANEHHDVSSKATIASKQSCMPATGTTNLDLMLFQMSRMRNPFSVGIVQPPVGAEPSDRWLKRLHLDVLDPKIPSSKRPNVGGGSPLAETNHMALRCNNEEVIDHIKEDKVSGEGIELQDDQRTYVPAKSMNYWIGRWCEGGTPVFHGDPDQRRQATKPGQASEELGGQFPSIAAMAMMGRAMNKLRLCEHQKKGPFVVWKTD